MIGVRSASRRRVSLGNRDTYGLNALQRTNIKIHSDNINTLADLYVQSLQMEELAPVAHQIGTAMVESYVELMTQILVDVPIPAVRTKHQRMTFARMQKHLQSIGVDCSERFRFQSFAQQLSGAIKTSRVNGNI